MLISRQIGFYKSQLTSPKFCIRYLMKLAESDLRTSIGKTLQYAAFQCGIVDMDFDKLTPALIKRRMQYAEVPVDQKWRISFAEEIKMIKNSSLELDGFLQEEIDEILSYICIS